MQDEIEEMCTRLKGALKCDQTIEISIKVEFLTVYNFNLLSCVWLIFINVDKQFIVYIKNIFR